MKEIKKLLEDFVKWASPLTLIAICISYFNLAIYYRHFYIPIGNFISVSEILVISFDRLLILFATIFLPLYFFQIFSDYFENKAAHISNNKKWILANKKLVIAISIVLAIVCLYYELIFIDDKNISVIVGFLFTECFFILLAFTFSFIFKDETDIETEIRKDFYKIKFITFSVMLIFTYTLIITNQEYIKIKYRKSLKEMQLVFNDGKEFYLSDSLRYIGQTQGYYFVYRPLDKSTLIIPASEIKQVVYFKYGVKQIPKPPVLNKGSDSSKLQSEPSLKYPLPYYLYHR